MKYSYLNGRYARNSIRAPTRRQARFGGLLAAVAQMEDAMGLAPGCCGSTPATGFRRDPEDTLGCVLVAAL